jgi:hypothetical protein
VQCSAIRVNVISITYSYALIGDDVTTSSSLLLTGDDTADDAADDGVDTSLVTGDEVFDWGDTRPLLAALLLADDVDDDEEEVAPLALVPVVAVLAVWVLLVGLVLYG